MLICYTNVELLMTNTFPFLHLFNCALEREIQGHFAAQLLAQLCHFCFEIVNIFLASNLVMIYVILYVKILTVFKLLL